MGQKISPEQVASLQKGTTTEDQAIATLGQPTNSTSLPDGTKQDTWMYVGTQMDPITFVPIAGTLMGGAKQQTSNLILVFDAHGVLTSKTVSSGQNTVNTGLLRQ